LRAPNLSFALGPGNPRAGPDAELRAATGGFPSRNIIGEGGFGAVYMGSLEDGVRPGLVAQAVAVKRGLANDYVEELLVCTSQSSISFPISGR
jgi:hypothetical protein